MITDGEAGLERLADRFPVARGRFAKGTLHQTLRQVEQTSRLIEANPAKRRKPQEQTKIFRDLVDHQAALVRQVDALLLHGMAVDADVAVIAGYLRRTQYIAAHAEDLASRAHGAIEQVADALADLADFVAHTEAQLSGRLGDIEERVARLETRMDLVEAEGAADRSLEHIVFRWRDGRSYHGIPWEYAVALLAYEVFAGPVGRYELLTGDEDYFRAKLANAVLASGAPWSARRPAVDVAAQAARELGSGRDSQMIAEFLGAGLPPELDGTRGELVLALRGQLTGQATAGEGLRLTGEGFCEQLVFEQAETALEERKNAWPPDLGVFGGR
jgi:hypothetical protein